MMQGVLQKQPCHRIGIVFVKRYTKFSVGGNWSRQALEYYAFEWLARD